MPNGHFILFRDTLKLHGPTFLKTFEMKASTFLCPAKILVYITGVKGSDVIQIDNSCQTFFEK